MAAPAPSLADPGPAGVNLYRADPNLRFALSRRLAPDDLARADAVLDALGAAAGGELDRLAADADRHPPELRTHDRTGERVDDVVRHPAFGELERQAFSRFGLAAASHRGGLHGFEGPLPHVLKYAMTYLFAQAEFGVLCPASMTDALAQVLTRFGSPGLRAAALPRLTATDPARLWQGAMFMTERTGGSDVGASQTVARQVDRGRERLPDGLVGDAPLWRLFGSKWFCSNVDAEVALVLARPEGAAPGTRGLGLFLLPRHLPDGRRNTLRIERLKDKLGTRDLATGEVTLDGALAYQVGDLARGFVQMAVMVNASRLSNAVRSTGLMRRGCFEAFAHARDATAFGARLVDLPLQQRVLLDLLLDVEGGVAAFLETAAVLQRADAGDAGAARLARILTPLLKAEVTKRARHATGEAMEARGGNGYVEEWVHARLLRDAHLGSIWEGTTNVVRLDVLRAMLRDGSHEALLERLDAATVPSGGAAAQGLAALLAAERDRLGRRCTAVLAAPRPRQEAAMPALSNRLFHLLAATCLAEEAADQLRAGGGARKLVVAAVYAASRLAGAARDLLEEPDVLALADGLERWDRVEEAAADELWALIG